jgi:radical SAM superfamily enzyme YgiQ (UPF0313 family)
MKTWICTTLSNFWAPTQGAARLFAYEKKQGHDVVLKDFNQDGFFKLLSQEFLLETISRLSTKIEPTTRTTSLREDIGSILINGSAHHLHKLIGGADAKDISPGNALLALFGNVDRVLGEITRSAARLDKEFLRLPREQFLHDYLALCCGKAIIDATYFPAQLDFGFGLHGTAYTPTTRSICRAIDDDDHNFLISYFKHEVVPLFQKEQPEVVGFSISHLSDLIPVLTLAKQIKEENQETHICLGGSVLTELSYKIFQNPQLLTDVDSAVSGPGEESFSALLECIETKRAFTKVPNLLYKKSGTFVRSEIDSPFDLNNACTPEFASLRPRSIIPLETSSSCYWGKCIFCYYPKMGLSQVSAAEQNVGRTRDIALVLDDFRLLNEKYDPSFIAITDSALHPSRITELVRFNEQQAKQIRFSAFIRFEKEFKSEDFCKRIAAGGFLGGQVGLESGSQRINNLIHKGVDLSDARSILSNMSKASVLIHLYAIVGIPGERPEESQQTLAFVMENREKLALDWQLYSFYAMERGPISQRAHELGINIRPLPKEILLQLADYTVKEGPTQEESLKLSLLFEQQLRPLRNPLAEMMDVESYKTFLLAQRCKAQLSSHQ